MPSFQRVSLAGACLVVLAAAYLQADEPVSFNRDIRPILAEHCFQCHGFDEKQREADLRLDVSEAAYAVRKSGVAINAGKLDESLVWWRINSSDADEVMPPPETNKTLTAEQKDLIRRWIEQGAPYQKHWAFEPPVKPSEPAVTNDTRVASPIDRFILARLEQEGLTLQPEADRETLIRRVAFALTGLPPTIAEVDTFLTDDSPQAYENMVDRYLASQRFGEEQARHWLDLARYADTHGLHLDNEREMWAYRDWVVKAFNENLPYDQFTTWQIAGDLLPSPSLDQRVATGFNRCNVTTSEGGSIAEEWTYRYAVDRTSTLVEVWMGLTAGCAVCHDHKFDPLTTKDFYSLYAFYFSAADPAMDGNIRDTNPFMKVPTPAQQEALHVARDREAALRQQLEKALANIEYTDPATVSPAAEPREIADMLADDDFHFGTRVRNTSRNTVEWVLDPDFGAKSGRRVIEMAYGSQYDITVELALIPVVIPESGRIECWLRVDPHYPPHAFALQFDDGKVNRRAVWGDESQLSGDFQHADLGPVPAAGEWVRLSVPFEKIGIDSGTRIKNLVLIQNGGRVWVDAIQVLGQTSPASDPLSSFDAWWRMSKGSNPAGITGDLNKLLVAGPKDDVAADKRDELLRFYLRHVQRSSESPVAEMRVACQAAELETLALDATIPGTFTFTDLDEPREAFVMLRGEYNKPGEKVEPNVPGFFPPLQLEQSADGASRPRVNRLDLARWLLSPEHPLTARVAVNRTWQQLFGIGLVTTSNDFGTRGDLPSHPELLDWLAVSYREGGWNTKELIRLLVTSDTFRQQSAITADLLQRDPENRLLARGPRLRLSAEQLRDNALFVSGLINLQMGGRGVMPYQPPGIWEPVGYENSNTRFYMQDYGPALYRRSLYCFLKRTAPPPFMTNFDGPNREQSCTHRERSNTPLQALQLMNDVQHFEAARALAERTIAAGGSDIAQRITYLYRTVLSREPTAEELKLLSDAFGVQYRLFTAEPEAASEAVTVGESQPKNSAPAPEVAAWAMIANLVLNLDETVTRN